VPEPRGTFENVAKLKNLKIGVGNRSLIHEVLGED
jgi:hypothetical protein